ncbi:MAG: hypothetical protein IPK19_27860 [Chloroflexi bacterium]|nr:hypothetical protein [Chloroflexota bacterium]
MPNQIRIGSRFYDANSLYRVQWTPTQTGMLITQPDQIGVYDVGTGAAKVSIPLSAAGAALNREESRVMLWGVFDPIATTGSVLILPTDFGALWRAAEGLVVANLTDYERGTLYLK